MVPEMIALYPNAVTKALDWQFLRHKGFDTVMPMMLVYFFLPLLEYNH